MILKSTLLAVFIFRCFADQRRIVPTARSPRSLLIARATAQLS
jgi:hypothetical protein